MNKKVNLIFSIIGFLTEIFYLINALHIWFRHITISFVNIIDSIFKILTQTSHIDFAYAP
ncbi:hypothetical protein IMSAGC013_01922 [Lachnospiraceae bacterium]|nr:hypothetical protein IMSAGC013_01922 [Lachnospiraceae bacterium]